MKLYGKVGSRIQEKIEYVPKLNGHGLYIGRLVFNKLTWAIEDKE